ncbi:uncharacterized protein ATNIH1004_006984 [Aspergillus tanneri]|uniref:Uncharacterized protein n=1 Tax=Aspergillus tanneri TaxID=1220188 RepID=A0A5M9MF12_9EURO|nr:uncharacterized protein ATNIH1004_006984 [Aspergillus tanneri]KAA8645565.1 hypothetical protein ATNIH1004_006984 [Aspergillus tanneri]
MNRGNMTYFGSLKYYPEKSESQNPATYEALHGRFKMAKQSVHRESPGKHKRFKLHGKLRCWAFFKDDPFLVRASDVGKIDSMMGTKNNFEEICAESTAISSPNGRRGHGPRSGRSKSP